MADSLASVLPQGCHAPTYLLSLPEPVAAASAKQEWRAADQPDTVFPPGSLGLSYPPSWSFNKPNLSLEEQANQLARDTATMCGHY